MLSLYGELTPTALTGSLHVCYCPLRRTGRHRPTKAGKLESASLGMGYDFSSRAPSTSFRTGRFSQNKGTIAETREVIARLRRELAQGRR